MAEKGALAHLEAGPSVALMCDLKSARIVHIGGTIFWLDFEHGRSNIYLTDNSARAVGRRATLYGGRPR